MIISKKIASEEYVDKAISNITGTTPGGSNQDFVVTVTSTVTDGVTTYTADKSYEEIKSNVDNGIEVSVKLAAQRYQLQADTGVAYIFGNTLITYDMPFIAQISIKNDNTVMYTMKSTQVSNMSSAISAADDNSKYPSNKAVVDYTVAKNQGVDNAGKVMVVGDDGLVAAEELPVQEQAIFCIILTGDKQNGYVTDKSYDEILEAYNNGKACLMYYNVNVAGVLIIDTIYALYEKSQNILKFRWTEVSNNGAVSTMFQISSDNQVSEFNYQFSQSTFATKNTNSTLTTTDKTIVGAINELNAKHTEGTDSLILLSPNGTRFSITVGDDGVLSATEITE